VCLVTGQSRSPFASQRELDEFSQRQEERYGKRVGRVGFYADAVADALALRDCESRDEAYSLMEALRLGMTRVLEMEREDVELLVAARPGAESFNAVLYDPMPGGSGLLDQACERWPEVVTAGMAVVADCPSRCERSCNDCLQVFRNAYYHKYLDRHLALRHLQALGDRLNLTHEIPARLAPAGQRGAETPANEAEAILKGMLDRAGFPAAEWHRQINLGRPLGTTSPDAFYEDPDEADHGICVYLDGLSRGIHGNPEIARRDAHIRAELRARGYEVLEIAASELSEREAMRRHFFRLGRHLLGRERAREVRDNDGWFESQPD
jgi:hypothetical protein